MMSKRNYQTCRLIREQIDLYLLKMSILFVNLGTDSTPEEVARAYELENEYIDKIAELDPAKAASIRPYGD